MTQDDVIAAIEFFGFEAGELADLVGESEARCDAWASGEEPAPRWLDHLFYCWSEHPETLALAREDAAARRTDAFETALAEMTATLSELKRQPSYAAVSARA